MSNETQLKNEIQELKKEIETLKKASEEKQKDLEKIKSNQQEHTQKLDEFKKTQQQNLDDLKQDFIYNKDQRERKEVVIAQKYVNKIMFLIVLLLFAYIVYSLFEKINFANPLH
ncbi:DUF3408 domain-containing protein [Campylobacter geochelonis]|uniref:DUF3408 domain-containing protein n=1 Tax=Campylobacter geochelonis TaxID=1780362 RepID=UPI000770A82F|nr:DUF3408 domain-containing protein [Campylobacter geochelonis]CZE47775.1 Uncharacterised protein [Campylobacter geochelonis]CZE50881.1 Uncharacterised protein [Campylobacter geochelonis]